MGKTKKEVKAETSDNLVRCVWAVREDRYHDTRWWPVELISLDEIVSTYKLTEESTCRDRLTLVYARNALWVVGDFEDGKKQEALELLKNVYVGGHYYPVGFSKKPIEEVTFSIQRKLFFNAYLSSETWANNRKLRLEHDGFKCQICGSGKNLSVHHITYERLGDEDLSDLITVCADCHKKIHETDLNRRKK